MRDIDLDDMNESNDAPAPTMPEGPVPSWALEVEALLTRAAALSVEHQVDPGAFMRGAWTAYVESRPELREHLEELELRQRIQAMRAQGVVGSA